MKKIKIAGVPEHFNLPWYLCIENGEFEAAGIDLEWTDVQEGTGRLCKMLRNNETDIAVILTEGIIKDIAAGSNSKIIQVFVKSPLIWGIHVAAGSAYKSVEELEHGRVAISRYGSGSHLMAIVNAEKYGWNTDNMRFEVVNTINGAIDGLTQSKADYFMWEKFMTKPVVDAGIFRRIGNCPTPWPCFVIAAHNDVIKNEPEVIQTILNIINRATLGFKDIPNIDIQQAIRYNHKIEDIREWLAITEWSQEKLDKATFDKVQDKLSELNIIGNKVDYETATG